MKRLRILLLAPFILLCGCATSYHPMSHGEGYSEIVTTSDSFLVTFRGNQFTESEKVMQYALTRAAELTLQNGYHYFTVTSTEDKTKSQEYSMTEGNASGAMTHRNSYYSNFSRTRVAAASSSSTHSGTIDKPGITLTIKCYKKKPTFSDVIDADYFLANNEK